MVLSSESAECDGRTFANTEEVNAFVDSLMTDIERRLQASQDNELDPSAIEAKAGERLGREWELSQLEIVTFRKKSENLNCKNACTCGAP